VGVRKGNTAGRKPIHIRCFGLGMTAQKAHPVVEIVDRDE
jgi:hypothetical protein